MNFLHGVFLFFVRSFLTFLGILCLEAAFDLKLMPAAIIAAIVVGVATSAWGTKAAPVMAPPAYDAAPVKLPVLPTSPPTAATPANPRPHYGMWLVCLYLLVGGIAIPALAVDYPAALGTMCAVYIVLGFVAIMVWRRRTGRSPT